MCDTLYVPSNSIALKQLSVDVVVDNLRLTNDLGRALPYYLVFVCVLLCRHGTHTCFTCCVIGLSNDVKVDTLKKLRV